MVVIIGRKLVLVACVVALLIEVVGRLLDYFIEAIGGLLDLFVEIEGGLLDWYRGRRLGLHVAKLNCSGVRCLFGQNHLDAGGLLNHNCRDSRRLGCLLC